MDGSTNGGDDEIVVRAISPSTPRWTLYLYGLQAALALVGALVQPALFRTVLLAPWIVLLGTAVAVRRRELRRPAELTLTRQGLALQRAVGRRRFYPLDDVRRLDIDPAGGPRILRLTRRNGRCYALLPVPEEQVPQVKAWWTARQGGQAVTGAADRRNWG